MEAKLPIIKIADGLFPHQNSIAYAGQNEKRHPDLMRWDRTPGEAEVKVFTDTHLMEVVQDGNGKKVALLFEPRDLWHRTWDKLMPTLDRFNVVLTHDRELVKKGAPFEFYPLGGSWIAEDNRGIHVKKGLASILVSAKTQTEGHKLRHAAVERFGDRLDVFGEPYTEYLPDKIDAIAPYQFSVVIENVKADWWFTEKLTDCLAVGTVPIYWGCPSVDRFFNAKGIPAFDDLDGLSEILDAVEAGEIVPEARTLVKNMGRAEKYACPEDWIMRNKPWVFRP